MAFRVMDQHSAIGAVGRCRPCPTSRQAHGKSLNQRQAEQRVQRTTPHHCCIGCAGGSARARSRWYKLRSRLSRGHRCGRRTHPSVPTWRSHDCQPVRPGSLRCFPSGHGSCGSVLRSACPSGAGASVLDSTRAWRSNVQYAHAQSSSTTRRFRNPIRK